MTDATLSSNLEASEKRRTPPMMSIGGRKAICDALGLDLDNLKSLTITVDLDGVHFVAEGYVFDQVAEKVATVLRRGSVSGEVDPPDFDVKRT